MGGEGGGGGSLFIILFVEVLYVIQSTKSPDRHMLQ